MTQPEQRVAEASALRRFFQEQWDTLQHLLHEQHQRQLGRQRQDQAVAGAVESIVTGTDGRLRLASHYKQALRRSARALLGYVEELAAALPPALPVSRRRLTTDPLLRRLIRSREQIEQLFRRNPQVQQFFADPKHSQCAEVFGLLSLLRYEKTVLGSEMRGDMILREVRQTAVNFTARQLALPRPSEEEARKAVRQLMFDSAVGHVKRQILFQRESLSQEQKRQARLHPEQSLNNPEVYLHLLTGLLANPQRLLQMKREQLCLNSMDIRLAESQASHHDRLLLYELGIGDERPRVISLVRYPRAEFDQG
ncbi:MAG: hypothetical protein H7842_09565 [Gammaproteobacteria bacterium SHHR-1]